jgi:hypothetical protein
MKFDNRHRISAYTINRILEGKELRATGLRMTVKKISWNRVDFAVEIVGEGDAVIATIGTGEDMSEGSSLTMLDIDRAFNITVSA